MITPLLELKYIKQMNIALPILLLIFGGLTFWMLSESKLKWYFKSVCIFSFCLFTVVFWVSIHSFLGWPADEDDMPEKILIHWVIIKEPNKFTKSDGAIYVLLQSVGDKKVNDFLNFFGYKKGSMEPRLYGLSYDRELHEKLEKQIMPHLRKGQPVAGKLTKKKQGEAKSPRNGDKKPKGKGGGSESQEQKWEFHRLKPSDIQVKPE